MRAIILAAGEAKRLHPYTLKKPKCLLDIKGPNILYRQITSLLNNGVTEVTIVVGFEHQQIRKYIQDITLRGLRVKFIHNSEYTTTNNAYSLYLALQKDASPFILLNGDVVYHHDLIKEVIKSKYRDCLAVQLKREYIEEDMNVAVIGEEIVEVSKNLNLVNSHPYEFTGIAKFTNKIDLLRDELLKFKNNWFENAIDNLLVQGKLQLSALDVTHYPCIEIDFKEDYDSASEMFPYRCGPGDEYITPDWEIGIRHGSLLNKQLAFELLYDTTQVLSKYRVKYWLNWGTLLGVIRDGDFIDWDTDIDVTVHIEDKEIVLNKVEPELKKLRCYIPTVDICFPEDRFYIRDKEKIELNFVEAKGDKYVYSPNRDPIGYDKSFLDTLDTINFKGKLFTIPNNAEQYLELAYGTTWKTPQKHIKPARLTG